MNSYELSRNWFDWCFENPEKISPNHTAIYFFALEHQNRLGGKDKFGFPSQMAMEALGIKKHQTYIKYFNELIEFGFIKLIEKSKNQYSANIISISQAMPKKGKALDKALIKHGAKQTETNGQSNSSIDKQGTIEQETINNNIIDFDSIWALYGKKGTKELSKNKFLKLKQSEIELMLIHIPIYLASVKDKQFVKNFETYINQKHWQSEINGVLVTIETPKPQLTEYVTFVDQSHVKDIKDRETFERMRKMMAGGGYVFTELKSEWK